MLSRVIEVQYFRGAWPSVLDEVPDPGGSISHHQLGLGPAKTFAKTFPVQASTQLQGLALPTNDHLFRQHPTATGSLSGLLLPVIDSGLPFVPFHAGLLRFLLSPSRPPLTHLPAVEHEHSQL